MISDWIILWSPNFVNLQTASDLFSHVSNYSVSFLSLLLFYLIHVKGRVESVFFILNYETRLPDKRGHRNFPGVLQYWTCCIWSEDLQVKWNGRENTFTVQSHKLGLCGIVDSSKVLLYNQTQNKSVRDNIAS